MPWGIPGLCLLLLCQSDIYTGARDPDQVPMLTLQVLYPLSHFPVCWFLNEMELSLWFLLGNSLVQCLSSGLTLSPLPQGERAEGTHLLQGHRLAVCVLTEGIPPDPLSPLSVSLCCWLPDSVPPGTPPTPILPC